VHNFEYKNIKLQKSTLITKLTNKKMKCIQR